MGNTWADLRFSLRALAKSPLFAITAILSLALGIGANTAIFTLLDQLLLRDIPVKNPSELVMLYQRGPHNGSNMGTRMHSYPLYQDYQQKAAPFSEVLCRRLTEASLSVDNQTERVSAEMVSGNFFTMLGVKPALGRVFNSREDDQQMMGHPVAVLGYDYWITRFNGDRSILGRKVLINNYPMTIIGVSARGFAGIDPSRAVQVRVPILMKNAMAPELTNARHHDRRTRWVQVFARLKPGYTLSSALPPLQGLFHQIREYESTLPEAKEWSAYARAQFLKGTVLLEQAGTGYSDLRNDFSKPLIVLMCMVGLVLLIACANVANLLIARAFARQKEIAVRLSIGATRWQLVRQLLLESLVLSAAGAVAGVALAVVMTRVLLAMVPTEGTPLLIEATPDWRILLFTLLLTCLTALLFGMIPALRASRPDLASTLKDTVGAIAGSGGSVRLKKGLVAAQVALSFLLLFGSGLFVRSLQNLKGKDTGFHDIDNLVTFRISPALNGYNGARAQDLYRRLLDQLRATPGVKSAGLASVSLLSGSEWDSTMSVEGHKAADGEDMQAFMNMLSPGYFQTMGISIHEGRDFDARDYGGHKPDPDMRIPEDILMPNTAIVNRAFADHFFPKQSAIGRHIGFGGGPKAKLDIEIIGVVGNSLYEGPREGTHRQVFITSRGNSGVTFYVRTNMDSQSAYALLRNQAKSLDSALPVSDMKTLAAQLDEILMTERLIALLSAGFGLLATILAAIGVYGVMAFAVARRRKEMGIRLALGAQPGWVFWAVLQEVLILLGIGLAVGVPSALALGKLVAAQLYGIQPTDPWTAGVSILFLVTVAAVAGYIPARRASRIDPVLALRYE